MATLHQRPAHNAPHNHGGIATGVPTTTTNQSHIQTQNQAQGNLCNHCHKWAKTPGHNFCSKTCANRGPTGSGNFNSNTRNNTSAATGNSNPIMNPNPSNGMTTNGNGGTNRSHNNNNQAGNSSNLCNFCRKKSKLPPHDFCGKTCATNAGAAPAPPPPYQAHATTGTGPGSGSAGTGGSQSIQTHTQNRGRGQGQPAGHASGSAARGSQNRRNGSGGSGAGVAPAPIDPVEITKMVVDQIPYLKSFIPQNSPLLNGIPASGQGTSTNAANALGLNFAGGSGGAPTSAGTTTTLHVLQVGSDTEDDEDAGECALAGCTNSRYIDTNGVKSSYCSQRHRQQAVALGMVDPCILCELNPQSDADYFCSRECREEALNKAGGVSGVVDDDEDAQVKAGKQ